MDRVDREIINTLQDGFPIAERPYALAAESLGITGDELIERVERLCQSGALSRFGPMYNAEVLGGAVTLAAMKVPDVEFDGVADLVNRHPEVAHNYAREHVFNMWFVIAVEDERRIAEVIAEIERETGLKVYNMPKQQEFFIGFKVAV